MALNLVILAERRVIEVLRLHDFKICKLCKPLVSLALLLSCKQSGQSTWRAAANILVDTALFLLSTG